MSEVSLFAHVEYDKVAQDEQKALREKFKELETLVKGFKTTEYKHLAFRALEEAYMWFGKAIREHQIERK